jgi:hypothetical protein
MYSATPTIIIGTLITAMSPGLGRFMVCHGSGKPEESPSPTVGIEARRRWRDEERRFADLPTSSTDAPL